MFRSIISKHYWRIDYHKFHIATIYTDFASSIKVKKEKTRESESKRVPIAMERREKGNSGRRERRSRAEVASWTSDESELSVALSESAIRFRADTSIFVASFFYSENPNLCCCNHTPRDHHG